MKEFKMSVTNLRPTACDLFYEEPTPVRAVALAIEDHKGANNGRGSVEFIHQLHLAEEILTDPTRLAAGSLLIALRAALAYIELSTPDGCQDAAPLRKYMTPTDEVDVEELAQTCRNAIAKATAV